MSRVIATSQRVAAGLSAVALSALALSACSSAKVQGNTGATPAGSLSSSGAPASTNAASTAAGKSSAGSGASHLALGGGSFCSVAKNVQAQQAKSATSLTDSPDALKSLLTQADQELSAFVSIAPSAIKGDVRVLATAEKSFFTAITAANYDVTKVSPSALAAFDTPTVTTATDHITAYLTTKCGIVEPTDSAS